MLCSTKPLQLVRKTQPAVHCRGLRRQCRDDTLTRLRGTIQHILMLTSYDGGGKTPVTAGILGDLSNCSLKALTCSQYKGQYVKPRSSRGHWLRKTFAHLDNQRPKQTSTYGVDSDRRSREEITVASKSPRMCPHIRNSKASASQSNLVFL
ncbi:hypothetical protein BD309DRAFT_557864 [Dichomitus squalens]|nr:hypothetical protein BD309DRAFT_557864 [Dichomitus squalens]